ncbi:MAG TPA: hypothetical protein VMU78_01195, partial [Methylocella sp.]|nr:hypothetical protein [Methylocella sp.]
MIIGAPNIESSIVDEKSISILILETAVGWFGFWANRHIIRGMTHDLSHPSLHPAGEQPPVEGKGPL